MSREVENERQQTGSEGENEAPHEGNIPQDAGNGRGLFLSLVRPPSAISEGNAEHNGKVFRMRLCHDQTACRHVKKPGRVFGGQAQGSSGGSSLTART